MDGKVWEVILMVFRSALQVIQDLKDGKIDVSKIDLDADRSKLINLPLLPEEPD